MKKDSFFLRNVTLIVLCLSFFSNSFFSKNLLLSLAVDSQIQPNSPRRFSEQTESILNPQTKNQRDRLMEFHFYHNRRKLHAFKYTKTAVMALLLSIALITIGFFLFSENSIGMIISMMAGFLFLFVSVNSFALAFHKSLNRKGAHFRYKVFIILGTVAFLLGTALFLSFFLIFPDIFILQYLGTFFAIFSFLFFSLIPFLAIAKRIYKNDFERKQKTLSFKLTFVSAFFFLFGVSTSLLGIFLFPELSLGMLLFVMMGFLSFSIFFIGLTLRLYHSYRRTFRHSERLSMLAVGTILAILGLIFFFLSYFAHTDFFILQSLTIFFGAYTTLFLALFIIHLSSFSSTFFKDIIDFIKKESSGFEGKHSRRGIHPILRLFFLAVAFSFFATTLIVLYNFLYPTWPILKLGGYVLLALSLVVLLGILSIFYVIGKKRFQREEIDKIRKTILPFWIRIFVERLIKNSALQGDTLSHSRHKKLFRVAALFFLITLALFIVFLTVTQSIFLIAPMLVFIATTFLLFLIAIGMSFIKYFQTRKPEWIFFIGFHVSFIALLFVGIPFVIAEAFFIDILLSFLVLYSSLLVFVFILYVLMRSRFTSVDEDENSTIPKPKPYNEIKWKTLFSDRDYTLLPKTIKKDLNRLDKNLLSQLSAHQEEQEQISNGKFVFFSMNLLIHLSEDQESYELLIRLAENLVQYIENQSEISTNLNKKIQSFFQIFVVLGIMEEGFSLNPYAKEGFFFSSVLNDLLQVQEKSFGAVYDSVLDFNPRDESSSPNPLGVLNELTGAVQYLVSSA